MVSAAGTVPYQKIGEFLGKLHPGMVLQGNIRQTKRLEEPTPSMRMDRLWEAAPADRGVIYLLFIGCGAY